jgi:DNA-directed RNA polymerase subunit RPC12/RpoP
MERFECLDCGNEFSYDSLEDDMKMLNWNATGWYYGKTKPDTTVRCPECNSEAVNVIGYE